MSSLRNQAATEDQVYGATGGSQVPVQIGLLFGQRAANPLPENLVVTMA
jgi:hypothetical protein